MAWVKEVVHDAIHDSGSIIDTWDNTGIIWESLTVDKWPAKESWVPEAISSENWAKES